MYQLLLRLRVQRDCAWESRYHRKIRGRLTQALDGTEYDSLHGSQRAGFTFSEPMPYADEFTAGDDLHLVVSAPETGILKTIAQDLQADPEMTAGSFLFDVRAATPIPVDVGPPGESGTITTSSGAIVTVDRAGSRGPPEYWTDRDHTVETFKTNLQQSVQRLIEHETQLDPPARPVFEEFHHRKTFGAEVEVTPANTITVVASKWDFGFEVRDSHHRKVLNALLGRGIGSKRSYGFGMLQVDGQTYDPTADAGGTTQRPREQEVA